MSCYHPLIGIPTGELTRNGKKKLRIEILESTDTVEKLRGNGCVLIPCGHCIGCRLDYSRSWADRMMLELDSCKKGIFLTLTYDNDNIAWSCFDYDGFPLYGTLVKKDCQLFLKRLRKEFSDFKLRFYLAGEYGSKTQRPHYHAIIFGLSIDDIGDCVVHGVNELGQKYYISDRIRKVWKNGNILVANVSWKTCAYVARYVTKKLNGCMQDERYELLGQLPEFSLMSRKPGIGAYYLENHPNCLDFDSINISTPDGGLKIRIPKYYLNKLELIDKERYDMICNERRKFAEDSMILKLQKTDLQYVQYLENEENVKLEKLKALKRNKI